MSHQMIEQFRAVGVPAHLIVAAESALAVYDQLEGDLDLTHVSILDMTEEDDCLLSDAREAVFEALDACRKAAPRYAS